VDSKWGLAALQTVSALPTERRLGWRKALQRAGEAQRLAQKTQYAKALVLWQERLKWCREVLGEEHPDTAESYNKVAFNLANQGKYPETRPK
jgi:hypothetical protein